MTTTKNSTVSYASAAAATAAQKEAEAAAASSGNANATATSPVATTTSATETPSPSATGTSTPSEGVPAAAGSPTTTATESAKTTTTTDESGDKAAKKASAAEEQRKKIVSLTPAPVPSVNPWSARSGSVSQEEPTPTVHSIGEDLAKANLDPSNWPKPDERTAAEKRERDIVAKTSRTGKEKWVPFTPVPAPQSTKPKSSKGGRKPQQANGHVAGGAGAAAAGGVGPGEAKNGGPKSGAVHHKQNLHAQPRKDGRAPGSAAGPAGRRDSERAEGSARGTDAKGGQRRAGDDHNGSAGGPQTNGSYGGKGGSYSPNGRRPSHMNNKNFYIPAATDYMYGQPLFPAALPTNTYEIALGMVVAQIEYYLSIENLCKDIFLRRHMNSHGLIPLSTLASFNRMKALTGGNFQLVLDAAKWAPSADVIGDRVRPKVNWEAWVMPFEERLPSGKDETVGEIPEIDQVPKFNPSAAVPFVPKNEGDESDAPNGQQNAKAAAGTEASS